MNELEMLDIPEFEGSVSDETGSLGNLVSESPNYLGTIRGDVISAQLLEESSCIGWNVAGYWDNLVYLGYLPKTKEHYFAYPQGKNILIAKRFEVWGRKGHLNLDYLKLSKERFVDPVGAD